MDFIRWRTTHVAMTLRLSAANFGERRLGAPTSALTRILWRLGLERIVKYSRCPKGYRQVSDVEHIPVIAKAVKVEKIGHLSVDQPVDEVVSQRASDDET